VISGILNQLAHDLAIDLDAAGSVVSSYLLAYGLSAPVLAALTSLYVERGGDEESPLDWN